jgi:hypothetical protein
MPQIPDHPPPSYLDQDPDIVSLRSAAPSYTSSVPPTYTPRTYTSLIPPSASTATFPIPTHHTYNVASWPSLSNQSQSQAYLNVAARRARRAAEEAEVREVRRVLGGESSGGGSSSAAGAAEGEALEEESRAWDFFTRQISDWEQREVSWKAFRASHERARSGKKGKGKGKKGIWGLYGRLG